MMKGRYTPENQLEDLGMAQFAVMMARKGWPFTLFKRDTGEDLLVRIFDKGNATGLDFLVQHKSTSRWSQFLLEDGTLSFPLEVADLVHWRELLMPVVLVVWDVEESQGRWLLLQPVLHELDKARPDWESQATLSLHLPLAHTFDEAGLERLRWQLASYVLPMVPEGELAFFLNSETGQLSPITQEAISRFVRFGETLELRGEEIKAIQSSPKWTQLFGPMPHRPESVLILTSSASESGASFRFDLLSHGGRRASMTGVELRRVSGGAEQIVLSNAHESSALTFTLVVTQFPQPTAEGKTGNITAHIHLRERIQNENGEEVPYPSTAFEARDAMEFLDVLADGGTLRLTLLDNVEAGQPKPSFVLDIAPNPNTPPDAERQQVRDFFNTLLEAETQFGVTFVLPGCRFSDKDLEATNELKAIFLSGRYTENRDDCFSMKKEGCLLLVNRFRGTPWKDGDNVSFWVKSEDATMPLLGQTLPLGNYQEQIVGPLEWTLDELEARAAELADDESLLLKLVSAHIVHTFPRWLPPEALTT